MKKDAGKKIVAERVEEFERNKAVLTKKGHGETNIRSNYIDILFHALGWDMKSHYEVVREFSQRDKSTESGTKKVDYAFKVNGKLKFFIEAKEASIDLEKDKSSIFQAKRYAYSSNGKAPIVILTDFEELRVFNVLKAPLMDNTDRELLKSHSMKYTEYIDKWDLLWDTFSKEAVENGSLDKLRGKIDKNTKTMDIDFLEQITEWRELLAKNIANRNKDLTVDEINEAVQRILDRLVFIRNLEDREIEPENTLLDKTKKSENIYKSIVPVFNALDKTYNGLLFKKHFSENIDIDDKTIKDIIRNMSYPVSPFQFDVIEPEILGRIYEKFLGSKIRLTANHQAKIEEKIEVRKAGGVYYTPEYIVEYIVANTVGKKIEGLNPEEIKKIKIVDPACGSGSFLIGAYAYLLEYHQKWYSANQKNKTFQADWYKTKDGEIKVSLDKRSDLLRNNIFGVDIDKEATEVAIMSLYLKMLDDGFDKGERDLFFVKGSILPDMIENIKCGNSLISDDYFSGNLHFDDVEFKHIKPFTWANEFKSIMSQGGFDCVIGNPPWGAELTEAEKKYLLSEYPYIAAKTKDSYFFFIFRSLSILKQNCLFGMIIPNTWLLINTAEPMRKELLEYDIQEIIDYGDGVFKDATVESSTIILNNNKNNQNYCRAIKKQKEVVIIDHTVNKEIWKSDNLSRILIEMNENKLSIVNKLKDNSATFDSVAKIIWGIKPYQVGHGTPKQTSEMMTKRIYHSENQIDETWKPLLVGSNVDRYFIDYQNIQYIKYGKNLMYPSDESLITSRKILLRQTSDVLRACLDENKYYPQNSIFIIHSDVVDLKYLVGLLNSKLFQFLYKLGNPQQGKIFAEIKPSVIKSFPIKTLDNLSGEHIKHYNDVTQIVDNIIEINKKRLSAKSESDKSNYSKQFDLLNNSIDMIIYKLYNLTDEEIKLIES